MSCVISAQCVVRPGYCFARRTAGQLVFWLGFAHSTSGRFCVSSPTVASKLKFARHAERKLVDHQSPNYYKTGVGHCCVAASAAGSSCTCFASWCCPAASCCIDSKTEHFRARSGSHSHRIRLRSPTAGTLAASATELTATELAASNYSAGEPASTST